MGRRAFGHASVDICLRGPQRCQAAAERPSRRQRRASVEHDGSMSVAWVEPPATGLLPRYMLRSAAVSDAFAAVRNGDLPKLKAIISDEGFDVATSKDSVRIPFTCVAVII